MVNHARNPWDRSEKPAARQQKSVVPQVLANPEKQARSVPVGADRGGRFGEMELLQLRFQGRV